MDDITLMQGNCLELMKQVSNGSVDMILCDLPYGQTARNNSNTFGYEWTRKDGKIVELRVTIKDGCNRSMEQEG